MLLTKWILQWIVSCILMISVAYLFPQCNAWSFGPLLATLIGINKIYYMITDRLIYTQADREELEKYE